MGSPRASKPAVFPGTLRTCAPYLTVSVENFLSFRKSEVKLGSLNVLVGPNGAGKTNFLKIFQFLGDVARLDLIPAIDGLGGFDELRFRASGYPKMSVLV